DRLCVVAIQKQRHRCQHKRTPLERSDGAGVNEGADWCRGTIGDHASAWSVTRRAAASAEWLILTVALRISLANHLPRHAREVDRCREPSSLPAPGSAVLRRPHWCSPVHRQHERPCPCAAAPVSRLWPPISLPTASS